MTTEEIRKIISLYGKDIYSFCCYLAKNKTEADDLYQDVFLKAMEQKDKISNEKNPKSYLLSIAVKLWKNYCRKQSWRGIIAPMDSMDQDDAIDISSESPGPEEQMIQDEQSRLVLMSLNHLSDAYRIPVILYYLNGLSLKEIAQCLNLPLGTVKSRIFKAKRLLKEELEAAGYER